MKPVTAVVTLLLAVISIAHLARLVFQVPLLINGMMIPMWVSLVGCVVPAALAWMLWKENR